MTSLLINQAVNVHWQLPSAHGTTRGDEVARTFANLIPACEFAAAMASEGNLLITLHPASGPLLNLDQARTIATAWETGKIESDSAEVEI